MPRIFMETSVGVDDEAATTIQAMGFAFRNIVAEVVTKYDPSFTLDPNKHTVFDPSQRQRGSLGDKDVLVTVRGMAKATRIDRADEIGDEIWARATPMMEKLDLTWSLSLCWDEHYYRDE